MDRVAFLEMDETDQEIVARKTHAKAFPSEATRPFECGELDEIVLCLAADELDEAVDALGGWNRPVDSAMRLRAAFETIEPPAPQESELDALRDDLQEIVRLREAVAAREASLREIIAIVRLGFCSTKLSAAVERARALLGLNRFGEPIEPSDAERKAVRP